MELWGRCGTCDRWFYCPTTGADDRDWRCPVCGCEPVAIENRAPRPKAAVLVLPRSENEAGEHVAGV